MILPASALFTDTLSIVTILMIAVVLSDWLARRGIGRRIGAAVIVIAAGAALTNLRIIPPAGGGGPAYDPIFAVVVPGSIFLILLEVNLKALRRAGAPMLGAFALGALGTCLGVLAAARLVPMAPMLGATAAPLGGMLTGTYIGGSVNFNAVALGYGVLRDSTTYTTAVVVDNVMTDVWILITLIIPAILYRTGRFGTPRPRVLAHELATPSGAAPLAPTLALGIPLALAGVALTVSNAAAAALAGQGIVVPSILIVTTLALLIAQVPAIERLTLANTLGLWGVFLFLAVVGASADLAALAASRALGAAMFAYIGIIFVVHGIVLIGIGFWLRIEPEIIAIASNANIGGSASAFVLAETQQRHDLVLPAILIGSLGNAIGTYAGFAIVPLLG
ncbi:MAG: hypothetical protein B7Y45_11590 [Sphingomonas sp. 28-66-16]|nr:MAG: hypothetical protein B7Y45_11590 [Sphingomonas sp. 28-66-16]